MKIILPLTYIVLILFVGPVSAKKPATLDEAKALSAQTGKPLLIEFYRDDCEYCALAAREAENEQTMIEALKSVVHIPICVQYGEGLELSDDYKVGNTFPVFILANGKGEVISRWTGYGGARRFIRTLKSAMTDLTSVDERLARYKAQPNFRDALNLAKFYSDTREYTDAIHFYELAQENSQGGRADYSYQIFTNTANAVWNGIWPFDSALTAADRVLKVKTNKKNISNAVRILGRVARRAGQTSRLGKYLYAALEATADSTDAKLASAHQELALDTILYITGDIPATIRAKEASLGQNWQNDPKKFFPYAMWCLERKINLKRAELYARTAADRASSGAFKAQVLHTLASILDVEGKYAEAVRFIEMAVDEDPSNPYYEKELNRIMDNRDKAKK